MRAFWGTVVLVLAVWLGLSGISHAKQVFLRDGSVLDCESFTRRQGQIVVKVNRDVILEFAPEEVDLRQTFPAKAKTKAKGVKPRHRAEKKPAAPAASVSQAPGSALPAAVKPEEAKPLQAAGAPKKPAAARPAPVPPAAAVVPVAPPVPAAAVPTAPAVRKAAQPEPAAAPAPGPDTAVAKAEFERRAKQNAEQIAEAIKKRDPALMKKALEAQKDLVLQQKAAGKGGQQGALGSAAPKPEPPWFKYFLMLVFCGLLIIVAMWVIFQKAGESGWKSLIPFYNFYILMQISGKPGWWFILLLVPVVGLAIQLLALLALAEKFGRSPAFGVGLLLLPMFFFPILAFGGSQYQIAVPAPDLNFSFSEEL
jgi:hypothetical protein